MQKRIDPSNRGFFTIFKKNALQFAADWHEPGTVPKRWIEMIGTYAARPEILQTAFRINFAEDYRAWPDLFAALLNFLRLKYSNLEKSKAGRLKKFLSQNSSVKWERGFGPKQSRDGTCSIWDLQDGEISKAFEHSVGGCSVQVGDVVKARKWVKKNQDAGIKFEKKILDKEGNLQIKGKFQRKK